MNLVSTEKSRTRGETTTKLARNILYIWRIDKFIFIYCNIYIYNIYKYI